MTSELRKRSLPQADAVGGFFCVYDEPSTDLCLHKNLHCRLAMRLSMM